VSRILRLWIRHVSSDQPVPVDESSGHDMSSLSIPAKVYLEDMRDEDARIRAGGLTAASAVLIGHMVVSVPVVLIIGTGGLLGLALGSGRLGLLIGILPAWVFWSFTVPRWRRWALRRGAPPGRTQRIAAATGLV
jgi:hypothetical protein